MAIVLEDNVGEAVELTPHAVGLGEGPVIIAIYREHRELDRLQVERRAACSSRRCAGSRSSGACRRSAGGQCSSIVANFRPAALATTARGLHGLVSGAGLGFHRRSAGLVGGNLVAPLSRLGDAGAAEMRCKELLGIGGH